MDDFKPFIAKVATGATLSREEARDAFDTILSGGVTNAQSAAFLMALRVRGETIEEIAGAVGAMRGKMLPVKAPPEAIDIVGTGGDSSGSYNVSTLASIITAACGLAGRHDPAALDRDERCFLGQQQPLLAGMDGQLEAHTEQDNASQLLYGGGRPGADPAYAET